MAEQKAVPERPKDDPNNFATSTVPSATPPQEDLPLGPETLEAQREGFKKAEQALATDLSQNPMQVSGVEADVQNALENPEASGPAGTSKEDVQEQAKVTQEGVKEQAETTKQQLAATAQSAPPPPQTTTDAPLPANKGVLNVGGTGSSAQPKSEGSLPVKQEGDPVQLAKDEGIRVQAGDPAQQHADEAVGSAPEPVSAGGPPANTPPGDTSKSTPPPPTPSTAVPKKRGRPRKHQ